jgi:hypothetical protein
MDDEENSYSITDITTNDLPLYTYCTKNYTLLLFCDLFNPGATDIFTIIVIISSKINGTPL